MTDENYTSFKPKKGDGSNTLSIDPVASVKARVPPDIAHGYGPVPDDA